MGDTAKQYQECCDEFEQLSRESVRGLEIMAAVVGGIWLLSGAVVVLAMLRL